MCVICDVLKGGGKVKVGDTVYLLDAGQPVQEVSEQIAQAIMMQSGETVNVECYPLDDSEFTLMASPRIHAPAMLQ